MGRVTIPISGFYQSDSLAIANQQCNNWYVNLPQVQGALSPSTLYGCSGLVQFETTGTLNEVNRGAHVKAGIPYFVNGTTLYRIDREVAVDGTESVNVVVLGTIPGSGRVSMADNGKELMVLIPGGKGYIVDEESDPVLQEITAPGFTANGNPQYVVFINSFFICSTDSKKFIRSDSNQGLVWNSLNSGTAEADPDDIVAPIVHKNQLFMFGSETGEVFEGVPQGGFGFQRINGFIINKGLFAPFSLISANDTFMFIGGGVNESAAVWALSGSTVQKVSTSAIDSALREFSNEEIQQAFAYTYAQNGAFFVGFSVGDRTFEFNTITSLWNERSSQVLNELGQTITTRWRANSVITAYSRVIVGDSQDGRLGVLNPDVYTEYDNEIIRTFTTQPFADQGNVLTVSQLELTVESGVGDLTTTDPVIRMSYSDDARKFNNELPRFMGKIGEFNKRCIWRRLGRVPRYRVFKFVMSDPVKPVVIKLEAQARGYAIGS